MSEKKRKATIAQAEAGRRNLEKFLDQAVGPPAVKHGLYSATARKRFNDKRTREGRALAKVLDSLVQDLGGEKAITSAQRLILSGIRSKLLVILLISNWLNEGNEIISEDGNMSEVIDKLRLFTESLNKDLKRLYEMKEQEPEWKFDLAEAMRKGEERLKRARGLMEQEKKVPEQTESLQ